MEHGVVFQQSSLTAGKRAATNLRFRCKTPAGTRLKAPVTPAFVCREQADLRLAAAESTAGLHFSSVRDRGAPVWNRYPSCRPILEHIALLRAQHGCPCC
jgi:hypothetical protein